MLRPRLCDVAHELLETGPCVWLKFDVFSYCAFLRHLRERPMAATQKQVAAIHLYRDLMEEIKLRLDWMHLMKSRQNALPEAAIREFSFLQLRMICELIALACLVAHGDIKATSRLRKEHKADRIMNDLDRLHTDFYPHPMHSQQFLSSPEVGKKVLILEKANGFPKRALLELYRKCGDFLHRGNLEKLTSPTNKQTPDIVSTGKRIVSLLGYHVIRLFDEKTIVCGLFASDGPDPGKVHVTLWEPKAK
jgi:hypothetical protein